MNKIRGKENVEWYLKTFENFENNLNGQSTTPIHSVRKNAIDTFATLGFPTTKNEEWKYTNVLPISEINFHAIPSSESVVLKKDQIDKYRVANLDSYLLVFFNGHFISELSSIDAVPNGLKIRSLGSALVENKELVESYLTRYAAFDNDSFTALNTAFIQDGAFIFLERGITLDKPIQILYLSESGGIPYLSHPRNLFILGESSQVKIIETYASTDTTDTYFTNAVNEIILAKNASLEHFKLQLESEKAYHIGTLKIYQERDSQFTSHSYSFGGRLVRNNIDTLLAAEGITSTLNGLYIAKHNQHVDNHTVIDHAKPNCESHELYKGILDDKAKGVFNGKIFVRQDAQKTNAIQANNCILLSDNATIDTKPQLEIFADDVKCTHGATIGQLDDNAFFYMRSRGINKNLARSLLIFAFASEVIDRIQNETIRSHVMNLFAQKLETVKPE
jgi:Fe-S cluster assembly protein SufD